jgi:hypothetical protein
VSLFNTLNFIVLVILVRPEEVKLNALVFVSVSDFLANYEAQSCRLNSVDNSLERVQVISISKGCLLFDINHVYSFDHLKQRFLQWNNDAHFLSNGSIASLTCT